MIGTPDRVNTMPPPSSKGSPKAVNKFNRSDVFQRLGRGGRPSPRCRQFDGQHLVCLFLTFAFADRGGGPNSNQQR